MVKTKQQFEKWWKEKRALSLEVFDDGIMVFTPTEMTVLEVGNGSIQFLC